MKKELMCFYKKSQRGSVFFVDILILNFIFLVVISISLCSINYNRKSNLFIEYELYTKLFMDCYYEYQKIVNENPNMLTTPLKRCHIGKENAYKNFIYINNNTDGYSTSINLCLISQEEYYFIITSDYAEIQSYFFPELIDNKLILKSWRLIYEIV